MVAYLKEVNSQENLDHTYEADDTGSMFHGSNYYMGFRKEDCICLSNAN